MQIVSSFLLAAPSALTEGRPTIVAAFDCLVDEKSLVVGITVGRVKGPKPSDVELSALGRLVLERAQAHHLLNYPQGVVLVAGVASVANAKERTRKVLTEAPPHSLVLLVCADNKTYDAAYTVLGVDLKSMNVRPQ